MVCGVGGWRGVLPSVQAPGWRLKETRADYLPHGDQTSGGRRPLTLNQPTSGAGTKLGHREIAVNDRLAGPARAPPRRGQAQERDGRPDRNQEEDPTARRRPPRRRPAQRERLDHARLAQPWHRATVLPARRAYHALRRRGRLHLARLPPTTLLQASARRGARSTVVLALWEEQASSTGDAPERPRRALAHDGGSAKAHLHRPARGARARRPG